MLPGWVNGAVKHKELFKTSGRQGQLTRVGSVGQVKHTESMILNQRMEDEQQNAGLAAMTIGVGSWPEKVKGQVR